MGGRVCAEIGAWVWVYMWWRQYQYWNKVRKETKHSSLFTFTLCHSCTVLSCMKDRPVHYSTVQCTIAQFNTTQYTTIHHSKIHYNTLQYTVQHSVLYCISHLNSVSHFHTNVHQSFRTLDPYRVSIQTNFSQWKILQKKKIVERNCG